MRRRCGRTSSGHRRKSRKSSLFFSLLRKVAASRASKQDNFEFHANELFSHCLREISRYIIFMIYDTELGFFYIDPAANDCENKTCRSLKKKAEKKHSKEYKKARERYPSPEY